jgi:methyl-accepting chemotaxis protein
MKSISFKKTMVSLTIVSVLIHSVCLYLIWERIENDPVILALFIVSVALLPLLYFFYQKRIVDPLKSISSILTISKQSKIDPELLPVAHLVENYEREFEAAKQMIIAIREDRLDMQLCTFAKNELTDSLVQMNEQIKSLSAAEKERTWAADGLASFVEILRLHNDHTETLCYQIISSLIKYVKANQGGLFILETNQEGKKYLNLMASYAYERRKYLKKEIAIGEGLIGQAILEKAPIYMTDIPEEYVHIKSGLGHANPRCLFIMPLLLNNEAYGAIELASFNPFKSHEIEFIKKLAESIASTISTAKVNEHTTALLQQSQLMTEELKAQEEEMRQSMEELEATQEEMNRKHMEIMTLSTAVDSALIKAEYAPDGTIVKINQQFVTTTGFQEEDLIGKNLMMFVPEMEKKAFTEMWDRLLQGVPYRGEARRQIKNGEEKWLVATYTPAYDNHNKIFKIIYLGQDITETKKLQIETLKKSEELNKIYKEMETQNSIINSVAIVSKTDVKGNITYVNDEFLKWSKYTKEELIGKNHRILKSGHQSDEIFKDMWRTIANGKIWRGEIKNRAKDGSYYWVDSIIAPVMGDNGKPKEYIAQRFVINDKKAMEEELERFVSNKLDEKSRSSSNP